MNMRGRKSGLIGLLMSGLIGLGLVAFSGAASATERNVMDKVQYVYPMGNGNFVIAFMNPQPACTSSATPQFFWVAVGSNGVTADGVKAMLAAALTALAADKMISLVYDDSSANCYVNRFTVIN